MTTDKPSLAEVIHNTPLPTHEWHDGRLVCRHCGRGPEEIQLLELEKQSGFECPDNARVEVGIAPARGVSDE